MQPKSADVRISRGLLPFALSCLLSLPLLSLGGCGEEEEQVITIDLVPWTLGFDAANDFYLVERNFYLSLLKFLPADGTYGLSGVIQPPAADGFLPWGLDLATGEADQDRVVFLTDVSTANDSNRLLAVTPNIVGEPGLDDLLLAETDGPAGDAFHELRSVATLYWVDNTNPADPRKMHRVFAIDHDPEGTEQIRVADYDIEAATFTFADPITWAGAGTADCPDVLVDPIGLAVDPDNNALYVTDQRNDAVYRFSGVQQGGTVDCDKQRTYWKNTEDLFNEPSGVAYLAGAVVAPDKNYIAVADAQNLRVTAFTWNGNDFVAENVPDDFAPFAGAAPFDLAFDGNDDLWATYPEASAIAGPR